MRLIDATAPTINIWEGSFPVLTTTQVLLRNLAFELANLEELGKASETISKYQKAINSLVNYADFHLLTWLDKELGMLMTALHMAEDFEEDTNE